MNHQQQNGFQSRGAMGHCKVLSATVVCQQEQFRIIDAVEWVKP